MAGCDVTSDGKAGFKMAGRTRLAYKQKTMISIVVCSISVRDGVRSQVLSRVHVPHDFL